MDAAPLPSLPLKTVEAIRKLAGTDGLSEQEVVAVAVLAYAILTPDQRLALISTIRKKPTRPGALPADRRAVVEVFDVARANVVHEMMRADAGHWKDDDDILAEAVRLTREKARTPTVRD